MRTKHLRLLLAVALGLVLAPQAKSANATQPASAAGYPGVSGAGHSFTPSFSADGRFVVFISQANNLVTNDDLGLFLDVFVRDLTNGTTTLVSVNRAGVGGGNDNSTFPTLSSNGQFVAFESAASNLAGNDTNKASDIFLRNLVNGTTRLISSNLTGTGSGNRASTTPLVSADGKFVVFESVASDLVPGDGNNTNDIFIRDVDNGVTRLVSVNAAGTGPGNRGSSSPSITPDGRYVAFVSTATDIVPGVSNTLGQIYVRDLEAGGVTLWASSDLPGGCGPAYPAFRSFHPVLSADGRYVAFKAAELGSNCVHLFRRDLQTGSNALISSRTQDSSSPEVSADGRFVAYESLGQVYVWREDLGTNLLVSVNSSNTGPANGVSHTPTISADGHTIAFLSGATNLVSDVTNAVFQVYVRDLVAGTTRLASANLNGTVSSAIDTPLPALSADGRLVAFESLDGNIVAEDFNQAIDIFVRDVDAGTTHLASQREPTLPTTTGAGLVFLSGSSVSADGSRVVFSSLDSNLAPSDTNQAVDVFVTDLAAGTTKAVSNVEGPGSPTNSLSRQPVISADGRFVAYVRRDSPGGEKVFRRNLETGATELVSPSASGFSAAIAPQSPALSSNGNLVVFHSRENSAVLVPGMTDFNSSEGDIFLRDMMAGTNYLVSINRLGTGTGNDGSSNVLFSPDARWVIFQSQATDLTANPIGFARAELWARDLALHRTRLLSFQSTADSLGFAGNASSAAFSGNSRYIAFSVTNNDTVFRHDLFSEAVSSTTTNVVVCTGCLNPSLSADGRLATYETRRTPPAVNDVFVKDLATGVTTLISVNQTGGGGNGHSSSPVISGDGRYVVFASKAGNLVDNDTNNATDVFVRDRLHGTTMLLSVNAAGVSGNRASSRPVLGPDGRTVVFQSMASDLVAGDFNDRSDIFVLRLSATDSDDDGMDDDWERTYFSTLGRDGSGDFDGDGHTDVAEFQAGTNPTDDQSILRVMTLTRVAGGETTVLWNAIVGRSYRVQYKEDITESVWTDLPGVVTANSSTGLRVDQPAGSAGQRFYRVLLVY